MRRGVRGGDKMERREDKIKGEKKEMNEMKKIKLVEVTR